MIYFVVLNETPINCTTYKHKTYIIFKRNRCNLTVYFPLLKRMMFYALNILLACNTFKRSSVFTTLLLVIQAKIGYENREEKEWDE